MPQKISIMLGATNARTAKGNKPSRPGKRGEESMASPNGPTQHGELAGSKSPEPSEKERLHDEIQYTKRNATRDWVAGRITTSDHKAIHDRANHALKSKPIHTFRGRSGERKVKGLY
jgi:hypothetical protein